MIAIEQQGHGHTGDIDRPLTNEGMADDTAELLRQLGIERADFFGYSMGGGIALQRAIDKPERVRKFRYAGGAGYDPSGLYRQLLEMEEEMKPEDLAGSPWQQAYAPVAPQPENWPALVEKIKRLDVGFAGVPAAEVQAIRATRAPHHT